MEVGYRIFLQLRAFQGYGSALRGPHGNNLSGSGFRASGIGVLGFKLTL